MTTIKLMHAKLHRVRVTDAKPDYVGSVTIDSDLLEKVGILPLEEVQIVNLNNGQRWLTYVLPGQAGSGMVCPNGGAALLCKKDDILIIWANEQCDRAEVLENGHKAKIFVADENNHCREFLYQILNPNQGSVEFYSLPVIPEGKTSEYLQQMIETNKI
ncbi:MAG: aspartate 1-decarboxylase [Trichodesmium sp. St16_bin4-tuft]|nr:aspartate 1-decarboxylase [Trichodesmium sp. MAG_R01]MDE5073899.1 aspartate 1-decarboxylase [Trichodesmium sp. St5_bin8]MDE5079689.1 aspartate 1-decarboxylase [Trichodesmium sp. St2_bin6]MDE5100194.1 aspartate 1-decarboxylase [Trichodesmium sp. St16_bin4-tuft]